MTNNKKLYRSKSDKMIFGVCGGLGDYFNIDPVILRIIFVVLAVWGGSGILIYLILAIVVPEKPSGKKVKNKNTEEVIEENVEKLAKEVEDVAKKHSKSTDFIFGITLLLIGLSLLINNFFPFFEFRKFWPVILIVLALVILSRGTKESN